MPKSYEKLLSGNQIWINEVSEKAPGIFDEMAEGQSPEFLWIGCADSRVPAEEITSSLPGSIFVQRNVANMVIHTDYNLLSVVNYAVKALGVKHIIICGHYGCGGVKAAMSNASYGLLDNWLAHIKDVYRLHAKELDAIEDEEERYKKFIETNVREQVLNVAKLAFIQEEWKKGEFPYIHGWIFDVEDGNIHNLNLSINSADQLEEVYRYD